MFKRKPLIFVAIAILVLVAFFIPIPYYQRGDFGCGVDPIMCRRQGWHWGWSFYDRVFMWLFVPKITEPPLSIEFSPPNQNSPMTTVEFADCDIDRDKDCDFADFEIVTQFIGQCQGGNNYNELADADHDGCVTEIDRKKLFPARVK